MSFQNPFEGKFHLGQKVIIVKKNSSLCGERGTVTNISRIICSGIPKVNPNSYLNGSYLDIYTVAIKRKIGGYNTTYYKTNLSELDIKMPKDG